MQGVEGQIFGPMSRTYAYALIGAVIATFTVTPVLSSILLPDKVKEVETFLVRLHPPGLPADPAVAVRHYRISALAALAFLVACGVARRRGLAPNSCPSSKKAICGSAPSCRRPSRCEAGMDTVARIRNIIKSYPPVRTVFSEQGRGDDGTDPDGSFLAEFFVPLKPVDQWPKGMTKEMLVKELSEQLNREFIGIDFNFSQYIQDNIEEAVSGVKGENSIKIFGRDLGELERLAKQLKNEIGQVPGVTDPAAFSLLGQPNLVVRIDRAKAARYGFSVADINAVVQAAIGGQEVTRIYEGEMNFALTVRLAPEYRRNVDAIRAIPVALPNSDPKAPDRLYRAERSRRGQAGNRRRLHLPRERAAVRAAEVQRARPRPRLDRRGGAGARRGEACRCRPATGWNGPANSARWWRPRSGWRSSCRSVCC